VIVLQIPSLNQRKDDIPQLVDYFDEIICSNYRMPKKQFQPDAIQALQQYDWTGNVRELRNVVERLVLLAGTEITALDVEAYTQYNKD
jgi:two-component system, NtrC family, nitrogen regulation response regulator NtrX